MRQKRITRLHQEPMRGREGSALAGCLVLLVAALVALALAGLALGWWTL